jgi:hypothetical protein
VDLHQGHAVDGLGLVPLRDHTERHEPVRVLAVAGKGELTGELVATVVAADWPGGLNASAKMLLPPLYISSTARSPRNSPRPLIAALI